MKQYRYEVHGFGSFPIDMLRYDQAKIVDHYYREAQEYGAKPVPVYVIQGKCKPTIGRWESFMWHVNNVETV